MMKKLFLIFLFCVCATSVASAQSFRYGSAEKMVDVSLEGLKGSYQKLLGQNRFLVSDIEGYRNHIQSLRQELDSLESQKTKLSTMLDDQAKTDAMPPAVVYRREIEQLMGKADSTSAGALEKMFQQKRSELDTALERSRKSLRAAHSNVDKIQRESAGSAETIIRLKGRQTQLRQQIADRQAGREPGSVKIYANQLDKEIAKLKSHQKKPGKDLSFDPREEPVDISGFTEESCQLRRRFVALQDENMRLRRAVLRLGTVAVSP